MKQKIYILLLIICLSLNFVFPAHASSDPVILEVSDASGNVGKTFSVSVNISNSGRISGGSFNICYDSSVVELIDCTKGAVFGNISPNINKTYAPGKVRISWMSATSIDSGEIICLTFKGIKAGIATVGAEQMKFGTLYAENLSAQSVDGKITVSESEGEFEVKSLYAATDGGVKVVSSPSGLFYDASAFEADGGCVYVASYDKTGSFVGASNAESHYFGIQHTPGVKYSKFLCWDGIKPLGEAVSVDDENVVYGFLKEGINSVTAEVSNSTPEDFAIVMCAYIYDKYENQIGCSQSEHIIDSYTTQNIAFEYEVRDDAAYVDIVVADRLDQSENVYLTLSLAMGDCPKILAEQEISVVSASFVTDGGLKLVCSDDTVHYDASAFSDKGKVYIASYDKSGRLIRMSSPDSFDFSFKPAVGAAYSKIFCWNGVEPLAEAIGIDAHGTISGVLNNGANNISIKVDNTSLGNQNIKVHTAEYDTDGKLITIQTTDVEFKACSLTEFDVKFNVSEKCGSVKILMWKKGIVPVVKNIILNK